MYKNRCKIRYIRITAWIMRGKKVINLLISQILRYIRCFPGFGGEHITRPANNAIHFEELDMLFDRLRLSLSLAQNRKAELIIEKLL